MWENLIKRFALKYHMQTMLINGSCIIFGTECANDLPCLMYDLECVGIHADEEVDINGNDVLVVKL